MYSKNNILNNINNINNTNNTNNINEIVAKNGTLTLISQVYQVHL